jgi:hypothetical protein
LWLQVPGTQVLIRGLRPEIPAFFAVHRFVGANASSALTWQDDARSAMTWRDRVEAVWGQCGVELSSAALALWDDGKRVFRSCRVRVGRVLSTLSHSANRVLMLYRTDVF